METYSVNELRKMFLSFFESKGHLVLKSFSLVPHNDNSLLLINSGMAPMKPYFTGQEIPPRRRVATCQKCIRTGDIENTGKTARHGTFFEMLGNFSFGDYFKREAIHWSWEFLTQTVGLCPDRLYPSVYQEDDEAFDIWNREIGIAKERIFRFGKEDNFWEHGAGPCGPCSEIYYDRGEKYGCGRPGCSVGCDCDRYVEVWNDVFSQFESDGKGHYSELKQKNIDTGMGLERLAMVVQDADSILDIDTVRSLRDRVCALAGKIYRQDPGADVSIRIVTDHMRSATFMISDGILPSNEGRGYVLRRIIRRAARHGRRLGIEGRFLADLSRTVIEGSCEGYPELSEKQDFIFKVLTQEEEKFDRTIDQGLEILADLEEGMAARGDAALDGRDAFRLYDTYGFPLDLTREILGERGFSVDEEGFSSAMRRQKEQARKARRTTNYMGADATVYDGLDPAATTEFVGYDRLSGQGRVLALTTETEVQEALTDGQTVTIVTDRTPFYATMGGQQGDRGLIEGKEGSFEVREAIKLKGGKVGHVGRVTRGMFRVGDQVTLSVDEGKRADTCKNHSATHLLQKALRQVLGTHVEQQGSFNNADRLRFDFSHFAPMTREELDSVEKIVNEKIEENLPGVTKVMGIEEARKLGAMALFGEKYGDTVRVVCMGDFSLELCGGTHVARTGQIRAFKILSESGVAAGVRRIEALTGQAVFDYYRDVEEKLIRAAELARATPQTLAERLEHMQSEIRRLQSENEALRGKAAQRALGDVADQVTEVSGVKLLAVRVDGVDMDGLRQLGDQLKEKLGEGVVVLASALEGKVNLIAMVTEGAQRRGAHAGNLLRGIAGAVGGGGGGRPNMAQAGGKDPSGIPAALSLAAEALQKQLS